MKRLIVYIAIMLLAASSMTAKSTNFVRVEGPDLVKPNGTKLFIQGTNLGN